MKYLKIVIFFNLIATSSIVFAGPVKNLKCKAFYRTIDSADSIIEKEIDFATTSKTHAISTYEAVLEKRFFFITWYITKKEFLIQTIKSDDETQSTISRASLDSDNSTSMTEVNGSSVYKTECKLK